MNTSGTAIAVAEKPEWTIVGRDEMRELAAAAAGSGYFPGIKTVDQALTLMALCRSEGLDPMQAVRRYHIIEGRPVMRSDAMQAEFQRQGGRIVWLRFDNAACEAMFHHPIHAPEGVKVGFSIEDARIAGLSDRPTWRRHPANMLRARVVTNGVRMILPGVVVGIYTEDEILDVVATDAAGSMPPVPSAPAPATKAPAPKPAAEASPADDVRVRTMPDDAKVDPRNYVDLVDHEAGQLTEDIREHVPDFKVMSKHQLHKHMIKAGAAAGLCEVFPEGTRVGAGAVVERGQDLYKAHRDWARTELARYVEKLYAEAVPSEAEASPKTSPAVVDAPPVREPGEDG